ncbi:uncharacterized protein METZ01_LOCUS508719, partial [marine metagenome]
VPIPFIHTFKYAETFSGIIKYVVCRIGLSL